jgi:cytochrome c-type biogenesis protein CcmE
VSAPETTPIAARPKNHIRLVFVVAIAALLGTFAVYTALIGDTTPLVGVAEAAAGKHKGESVRITGKVVSHTGDAGTPAGMVIVLEDNESAQRLQVHYRGSVPDAFRDGRRIVVDGRLDGQTFAAVKDTLVTKCPSKYTPPTASTPMMTPTGPVGS